MNYEIRLLLPLPLQAVSVDPLAECLQLILHFEVTDTQLLVKDLMISYVFIMLRATLVFSCLHSPSMFLIFLRRSYCYSLWFLNYIGFEDLLRSVILHDSPVAWIVHRHLPSPEETKLPRDSEILSTVEVLRVKLPQRSHQQKEAAQKPCPAHNLGKVQVISSKYSSWSYLE